MRIFVVHAPARIGGAARAVYLAIYRDGLLSLATTCALAIRNWMRMMRP